MTDIDLTAVPLSALTAEIKRRRDEWESAQKDLVGFGAPAPKSITQRAKFVSGKPKKRNITPEGAALKSVGRSLAAAKKRNDHAMVKELTAKKKELQKAYDARA
jgi:cobalamin biosynthesis protein CobT